MIRLIVFGAVGYLAYRIGREFVESVPAGFEPTPAVAPTARKRRVTTSAKRKT